jgi:hypothetical protein
MSQNTVITYLRKRAVCGRWPLVHRGTGGVAQVVVIPALAEHPALLDTLHDLENNESAILGTTLVCCVVNNRPAPQTAPDIIANNAETLDALAAYAGNNCALRLAWVDASSPGKEMTEQGGVGLARKIGLDWGLTILHANNALDGPIISLDADTRVEPGYLSVVHAFFQQRIRWAAAIDYAHALDGPEPQTIAIAAYEAFLRYHEIGLHFAGSPYAFPTIGSAMACTARAYAAVSGMNTRQAGEDFYFLQQLAKTGTMERITGTTVHPSARPSFRVPFGTGRSMARALGGEDDLTTAYDPRSYRILKTWLNSVTEGIDLPANTLMEKAQAIDPSLAAFLHAQAFPAAWPRIQSTHRKSEARLRQFHIWFDGFRTLKFMHYLRDHGYPDQDLITAVETLLLWRNNALTSIDKRGKCDTLKQMLLHLRKQSRALDIGAGEKTCGN